MVILRPQMDEQINTQSSATEINWRQYLLSLTPLICGAIGPVAILLAISGRIDPWRAASLSDGSQVSDGYHDWVRTPTLIAIIMGVIANIFVLARLLVQDQHPQHLQYWSLLFWVLECTNIHI